VFAYTAQFGNGLSASISAENPNGHRVAVTSSAFTGANPGPTAGWVYGNQQVPDIVANLRIDQAWGSAQIMGAYHQLVMNDGGGATAVEKDDSGWAFGAGLRLNAPMLGKGDYVQAQFTYAEGASLYVASNGGVGFALTSDNGTTAHVGPIFDAVIDPATGSVERTKGWSVTAGYEHRWNPQWKTSLYGAYGEFRYSDEASAVLAGVAGFSADWDYAQIGSRTVWTPVPNLDLSLEVMYHHLDTAFADAPGFADKSWGSGIFRIQRNFYP
jgi:hypothetical protein